MPVRLHLTKHLTVLTRAFFNTSFLEPQKPDFSQKKATKVDDHQAPRSQRSKKIWLVKIFLFDFSPNWTILSHLTKFFFRPFEAFKGHKGQKGQNVFLCQINTVFGKIMNTVLFIHSNKTTTFFKNIKVKSW